MNWLILVLPDPTKLPFLGVNKPHMETIPTSGVNIPHILTSSSHQSSNPHMSLISLQPIRHHQSSSRLGTTTRWTLLYLSLFRKPQVPLASFIDCLRQTTMHYIISSSSPEDSSTTCSIRVYITWVNPFCNKCVNIFLLSFNH